MAGTISTDAVFVNRIIPTYSYYYLSCLQLLFRGEKIQSDSNTKRHVRLRNYYLRCCLGASPSLNVCIIFIYIVGRGQPSYYTHMCVQRDDTIWSKQRVIFFIHFVCKKKVLFAFNFRFFRCRKEMSSTKRVEG